jgi:hypothetical protein
MFRTTLTARHALDMVFDRTFFEEPPFFVSLLPNQTAAIAACPSRDLAVASDQRTKRAFMTTMIMAEMTCTQIKPHISAENSVENNVESGRRTRAKFDGEYVLWLCSRPRLV